MLRYWNKYHHSIWSGLLLLIRTLAGFGAQKVVAILYGPSGTTLFSHFQNLVALFTQPIQDAVANGLINAFPKKSLRKPQIIGSSIILLSFLVLSTGIVLLITNQFQRSIFSFSLENWLFIGFGIVLFCFGLVVSGIYVIQKKLMQYSLIVLSQWTIFFFFLIYLDFNLNHFLIFWLSIQSLFSLILILPIYTYLKISFKIDKKVRNHFKQFLIMAITIWLSSKWVNYFVREYAIQEFGSIQTGLWQSVVRISEAYRGLIISFLFLSLYPMLSKKLADGKLVMDNLRKYYLVYALFSITVLFAVFLFKDFILKFLYDTQYVEASQLFQLQIIGDVFAFLAFPFTIYLIASVKTKSYIITELVSAVIFVTLIILMTNTGIEVLVYVHIVRFICYSLMVSFVGIKSLKNAR
jgi:PST family polysaccharide transporter